MNGETIALLLAESGSGSQPHPGGPAAGATRLVRHADGRISLEAIGSEEELERTARHSSCFRRGKPIIDPVSREVIGYEMVEVPMGRAGKEAVPERKKARLPLARAGAG